MTTPFAVQAFVDKHLELIELERRAEVDEARRLQQTLPPSELERRGLCLLRLQIDDVSSGLGGRTLLKLSAARGGALPANRFQSGDIVTVQSSKGSSGGAAGTPSGVVENVTQFRITVALDDEPEGDLPDSIRLDRVANDVTFRRLRAALGRLREYSKGPARRLRDIAFGLRDLEGGVDLPGRSIEFFDPGLDAPQREAVARAVAARDVALIHGPPGTGKTTALVEVIHQCASRGDRVLACAPSNVAVDNLIERLDDTGLKLVRIGHPARLLPTVRHHSLDALVEGAEERRIVKDARRELDKTHRRLGRVRDRDTRRSLRQEVRRLRGEVRELERGIVRKLLDGADVIFATTTGAAWGALEPLDFDLVAIDEAAQALEAACWIALLRSHKGILAGDHLQLPPTVVSREAESGGLAVTLFDRLAGAHGDQVASMLTVQYRMHREIMNWSSNELYDGRLEAHASVEGHLLSDLDAVTATEETSTALLLIDTAGRDFDETQTEDDESKSNEGEATLVVAHVAALVDAGVQPADIGVITPYNAQVDLLRMRLRTTYPDLEIDSVDGFQGREKEAIVLSLVRSNPGGKVGFLADKRRLNVAVTRARRHVALVCDTATVARDPFLERLVAYFQEHGVYRSAWEY